MRSQDVLHSAYMPHFRAQMNCVPGMITEFSFTPTKTTAEMRMNADVAAKVDRINKIRYNNSQKLIAKGEEAVSIHINLIIYCFVLKFVELRIIICK